MTIEAAIHDKAIQFCGDAVEMRRRWKRTPDDRHEYFSYHGRAHPPCHALGAFGTLAPRFRPTGAPEGHAVPAVYAALADLGAVVGKEGSEFGLTRDHLLTLRDTDSVLDGHPNPAEGMPFFDAATGSLGQGSFGRSGDRTGGLKRRGGSQGLLHLG